MFASHSAPRQFHRAPSNHLSSFHSQLNLLSFKLSLHYHSPANVFQPIFLDPTSLYFLHPPPSHRTRIFNPFPKWCSGLIAIIAITYLHPTLALARATGSDLIATVNCHSIFPTNAARPHGRTSHRGNSTAIQPHRGNRVTLDYHSKLPQ